MKTFYYFGLCLALFFCSLNFYSPDTQTGHWGDAITGGGTANGDDIVIAAGIIGEAL